MTDASQTAVAPRPLRRDAERNRQRILASAAVLFAERGVDIGLDDVARHAGVGVGTVYRRFPDRETLIDEFLDEKTARVESLAREALGADDPWTGFAGFLEQALELHAEDRSLKQALLVPTRGKERLAAARARIEPLVAELAKRAQVAAVSDATHETEPGLWRRYARLVIEGLATSRTGPGDLGADALDREHLVDALCTSARER